MKPTTKYSYKCRDVFLLHFTSQSHILRAVTSAATFLVAPGLAPQLFKIDSAATSAATSAASILTTFMRGANR